MTMVDQMLAQGVPIHGIGVQMHTHVFRPEKEVIAKHLAEAVKRGLWIHFSELDVENNHSYGNRY